MIVYDIIEPCVDVWVLWYGWRGLGEWDDERDTVG